MTLPLYRSVASVFWPCRWHWRHCSWGSLCSHGNFHGETSQVYPAKEFLQSWAWIRTHKHMRAHTHKRTNNHTNNHRSQRSVIHQYYLYSRHWSTLIEPTPRFGLHKNQYVMNIFVLVLCVHWSILRACVLFACDRGTCEFLLVVFCLEQR